jgi:hypothetical protein
MPTSITISDQLRKKIKKMAALLDTSQAEIIARAIDEYEKKFIPSETFTDPVVIIEIKKASERIYSKYPERKKRCQRLMKANDILDSISPSIWGKNVND